MFEKKPHAGIDYDSLLGPDFLGFLKRTEEADSETKKLERGLELMQLEWGSNISEASRKLGFLKQELTDMKERCTNLKQNFLNLVSEFKMNAAGEDMEKLKRRVDDWHLERFITRKEFEKFVREKKLQRASIEHNK